MSCLIIAADFAVWGNTDPIPLAPLLSSLKDLSSKLEARKKGWIGAKALMKHTNFSFPASAV
jgi:hypothetical protein